MKSFSEYSGLIEKGIQDLKFPGEELGNLYNPISYALGAGGKRLRPSLLMMAADAYGNKCESAISAALGIEMFHNFTLLHDDVMDKSDTRRGRPTVHAKWDENRAILSGDTMLTLATQLVGKVEDRILREVLDTFNSTAIRVYEGQQLDMDFENREDVTIEEYIRMIEDKTGALIAAAVKIGAMIGGATVREAERIYEYGMKLGVAFQIQDDWLDVFGDSTTFGKPVGGDINNNKKTFLMLSGLCAGGPDSEALKEALQLPAGPTKVRTVTRIYEKMRISEISKKEIARYSSLALVALKDSGLDEVRREPFRALVDKLTGRDR